MSQAMAFPDRTMRRKRHRQYGKAAAYRKEMLGVSNAIKTGGACRQPVRRLALCLEDFIAITPVFFSAQVARHRQCKQQAKHAAAV